MRTKLLTISTIALITVVIVSCGSKKKALESQNQLMQQQLASIQQQNQQAQQNVNITKTARKSDPCEDLAVQPSEYFRAAGTAIADKESNAKNAASTDARNQLAQMMRVVVNGASQDKNKNTNINSKVNTEAIGEEIMNQYVYQSLELTRPIKWSVYDLSNGKVQVYVCMETTKTIKELEKELQNRLQNPQYSAMTNRNLGLANMHTNPEAEQLYIEGRDNCTNNDFDMGMLQLLQAIEMGSVNAIYYVGMLYLNGTHYGQDSKTAFTYILSAANNAHKEAVFQVAEMYRSGTGTQKDKVQAKFWYRRAKELGDTRADSRLRRL